MKKQILAATLSLSILALGGTALAANSQTPVKPDAIRIESKSTVDINKTGKTAAAAVYTQNAVQAKGAKQDNGSLNAGVSVNRSNEQSAPGSASAEAKGSIVTGSRSVDGGCAVDAQNDGGHGAFNARINGSLLGQTGAVNTGAALQVSNDGDARSIKLEFSGRGSAASDTHRVSWLHIDKIDDLNIISQGNSIFDELEELQELPEEWQEELEELDELDELGGYGEIIRSVVIA